MQLKDISCSAVLLLCAASADAAQALDATKGYQLDDTTFGRLEASPCG